MLRVTERIATKSDVACGKFPCTDLLFIAVILYKAV